MNLPALRPSKEISTVVHDASDNGPDVTRLDSTQALEPGHHWTAIKDIKHEAKVGETLLLLDVIEFEDRVHSVKLRNHPRYGEGTFTLMVDVFLDSFVPCKDAESIRQREQQEVMNRVTELQNELMQTQMNPQLMLEAVRPAVEKELANVEEESSRDAERDQEKTEQRNKNLDKTHRRAARRSEAKGNPLALPKIALASEVGSVIEQGIDASGVAELSKMAQRQAVVAKAQSNWLTKKTDEIASTLKALTPYISERAAVALARSSGALKMAKRIQRGIESLDLYTGKGIDVFDICTGAAASTTEPLTLVQGKRYAEEELAAWADVDSDFDYRNKEQFFKALAENKSLRDQVLPAPRCVVSIAMTRNARDYGNAVANLMNNIENQLVFLLVRNGDNIHVVYSSTPSHEGAPRLFPTKDELERPFMGWDGSKVSIRDIEFGEGMKRFDEIALSYKRFLILLCGLDHRLKLLGDFYPEQEQMEFMTVGFQSLHFRFVADDENDFLIGRDLPGLSQWVDQHNLMVQSGSRVFAFAGASMTKHTPELVRRNSMDALKGQFLAPKIVSKDAGRLIIRVAAQDRWSNEKIEAKCELADENNQPHSGMWWLCVDAVQIEDVRRFIHSRVHRGMGVGYLRLMRRLEVYLQGELDAEKAVRDYLIEASTTHGGLTAKEASEALVTAIRNWRASRRGAPLPGIEDKKAVNEVLSLMIPQGRLPGDLQAMLDARLASSGEKPLLLTRSGKSKLVLYVEASDQDRAPYPDILAWGWVKRITLEAGKTKLKEGSSSLVWLGEVLTAAETEVRRWDGLEVWMHKDAEPVSLRKYQDLLGILDATQQWAPVFKTGPGAGIPATLFDWVFSRCNDLHALKYKSRSVATVLLPIPVAAYSTNGHNLSVAYMQARAESVLWFYGSTEQKAIVSERFIRRYANKEVARKNLTSMQWHMTVSSQDLSQAHDAPVLDGLKSADGMPKWALRQIQQQHKRNDFVSSFRNPTKKKKGEARDPHERQPMRDRQVSLSLNRAFDELMGASVKGPKAAFYKNARKEIKDALNWPFDREQQKAKVKRLKAARFEHKLKAIAGPLVWSKKKNRSMANEVFSRHFAKNKDNKGSV